MANKYHDKEGKFTSKENAFYGEDEELKEEKKQASKLLGVDLEDKKESKILDLTEGKKIPDSILKKFEPKVVSVKDLVDFNKLLDNTKLSYRSTSWGKNPDTWKYDKDKDTSGDWIVRGVKKGNNIVLEDGMHRIRAIYNSGYDKVKILVRKE